MTHISSNKDNVDTLGVIGGRGNRLQHVQEDYIEYVTATKLANEDMSYAMEDVLNRMTNLDIKAPVTEILELYVPKEDRGKGIATTTLTEFINLRADKEVIIIVAGLLKKEHHKRLSIEEHINALNKLERFYTKIGFINVNQNIGCYEERRAMILNKGIGKQFLEKLNGN